jgi:hypothetical protein
MRDIRRWFGWLIVIGPIHLGEQILFGIDELDEIKRVVGMYYGWFRNPDQGTAALVGIVFTVVLLMLYGMLLGRGWRLAVMGFFGVVGVGELHHILKTVLHGAYFPGTVTAIPFIAVGALLLRAIARESRSPTVSDRYWPMTLDRSCLIWASRRLKA